MLSKSTKIILNLLSPGKLVINAANLKMAKKKLSFQTAYFRKYGVLNIFFFRFFRISEVFKLNTGYRLSLDYAFFLFRFRLRGFFAGFNKL